MHHLAPDNAAGVSIFGQRRGYEAVGEVRPTQSIRVVKETLIHSLSTANVTLRRTLKNTTLQPAVMTVKLTLAKLSADTEDM